MEEAGLAQEEGELLVGGVGVEATVQVERLAVEIDEVDRPGGVGRSLVEERPQHHPPVEEVVETAALLVQVATGEEPHRCAHVVHEVGELLGVEPHPRRGAVVARSHLEVVALERERPAALLGVDRQRAGRQLPRARKGEPPERGDALG